MKLTLHSRVERPKNGTFYLISSKRSTIKSMNGVFFPPIKKNIFHTCLIDPLGILCAKKPGGKHPLCPAADQNMKNAT